MTTYPDRSSWEIETGASQAPLRVASDWSCQTLNLTPGNPVQVAARRTTRQSLAIKLSSLSTVPYLFIAPTEQALTDYLAALLQATFSSGTAGLIPGSVVWLTPGESITIETQGECWVVAYSGTSAVAYVEVLETFNVNVYESTTWGPSGALPSLVDVEQYS
jgi:hypothetical protein